MLEKSKLDVNIYTEFLWNILKQQRSSCLTYLFKYSKCQISWWILSSFYTVQTVSRSEGEREPTGDRWKEVCSNAFSTADAKMQRRKTTTHFRTSSRLRNRSYITSEKWLDGWVGQEKPVLLMFITVIYADIVGELVKKVKNYADVIHQFGWSLTQT